MTGHSDVHLTFTLRFCGVCSLLEGLAGLAGVPGCPGRVVLLEGF